MVTEKAISRELMGKIVDEVFDGAIEDASVIEEIYACIKRHEAALSTDAEPVAWLPTRRWEQMTAAEPWLTNIVYSEDQDKLFPCIPLYDRPQQPAPSVAVKALADAYQEYLDAVSLYNERHAIMKTKPLGTMRVDEEYKAIDETRRAFDKLAVDVATSALSAQVQDADDMAAINLGASVLAKIADPAVREAAIRNALTAALNRDTQAQEVEILAGWQLVPKEPTSEMTLAGQTWRNAKSLFDRNDAFHVYRAMLAAAPAAKLEGKP